MIDVHRWQGLHVVLAEVEPNAVLDTGHSADRDGHLLAPPEVPLLEEHVGDMVVAGLDDQPVNLADIVSVAWTCSPRRTATSPKGTVS
jgi:hypothetical protein